MTASQSLKISEVLQRHFNNDADARVIVQEIEQIVENKFETNKNIFSSKEDISKLSAAVFDVKAEVLSLRVEMEKRFTTMLMWIIGTMIALIGIVVTILKLTT